MKKRLLLTWGMSQKLQTSQRRPTPKMALELLWLRRGLLADVSEGPVKDP